MIIRLAHLTLLLILLLGHAEAASAADLNAWLDRSRIGEGETVQLTLEAQGQVSGRPDTTPLEGAFDVLGISSGSRIQITNGRSDARTTWTLTLSPKQSGRLTIPSLRVGNQQSQPLTLEVSNAPAPASDSGADILIESEIEPRQPYVQGQVIYTVRLLHAVPVKAGSLSDPNPEQTLVQRLGEDREYATMRHGRRYQVIERRYALFPQQSGTLELPAPRFDGEVPDAQRRSGSPFGRFFGNDPFFNANPLGDLMTPTRRVRIRGKASQLQVQPRPSTANGSHWLPAESLDLKGKWQPDTAEGQVGQPITLQLDLRAKGLTAGQLPNLAPASVDGFDLYPDQAQRETDTDSSGVTGHLQQKIAFMPKHPGKLTLPAIELHWWDTRADQEQVATLPGRVLQVTGQAQPVNRPTPPLAASVAPGKPTAATGTPKAEPPPVAAQQSEPASSSPVWIWISSLLAIGWLLTLLFWWGRTRQTGSESANPAPAEPQPEKAASARRQFHAACRDNDPAAARRALLAWAAVHWPEHPPRGVEALARHLTDPEAQAALTELNRVLYREGASWDGSRLADALKQLPKRPRPADHRPSPLPPLYPEAPPQHESR